MKKNYFSAYICFMARITSRLILLFATLYILGCNSNNNTESDPNLTTSYAGIPAPKILNFPVIARQFHDTSAYTQGLQYYKGILYESTGDYSASSLRKTDRKTGQVLEKHMMGSNDIFGEGMTILNDTLYQLTWTNHIVYVYTIHNLAKPIKTFNWPYEGWGITNNGKELIVSDGSANLYFVNPADFRVINTVRVTDNRGTIKNLNELEYVKGKVYANVYLTNDIIEIDPESGQVTGKLTLNNLLAPEEIQNNTDVLNGIAYDSTSNTLLITGKRWPRLFELRMP